MADLEQHVAGADVGDVAVLDVDPALLPVDGDPHG